MTKKCFRCGSIRNLEADHIVPKKKWALFSIHLSGPDHLKSVQEVERLLDGAKNRRWLCRGCHDFRHAHDDALEELGKALTKKEPVKVSMWIFRLGLIEAANTPELVRERGYRPYWSYPETHYGRWYPRMKSLVNERLEREQAKLA